MIRRALLAIALCLSAAWIVGGQMNGSQPAPVVTQPLSVSSAAPSLKFINGTGAAVNLKAAAGNLYGFCLTNETAAVEYAEFFNTASAPTLGTTAVIFAIKIPISSTVCPAIGSSMPIANFSSGIGFASVTAENGSSTASITGAVFYQ